MSIAWMTRVWDNPEPRRASHRLLLLALADNANDQGVCWPSLRVLERRCSSARRDVQRRLDWLEAYGFVERIKRPGRSTVYRLTGEGRGDTAPTGGPDVTRDTTPAPHARTTRDTTPAGDGATVHPPRGVTAPAPPATLHPPGTIKEPSITVNNQHSMVDVQQVVDTDKEGKEGLEKRLAERGVHPAIALTLVGSFEAERIRKQLEHLDRLVKSGKEPRNPAAWLVQAIREEYAGSEERGTRQERLYTQPQALAWCRREGIALSQSNPLSRYFETVEVQGRKLLRHKG